VLGESGDTGACGVCGRTILRGERVAEYASPEGERVTVCTLCKPAAERAGWVPAELAAAGHGAPTRRRGLGLRERLGRASDAARELAARASRPRTEDGEKEERAPEPPKRSRAAKSRREPARPRRAASEEQAARSGPRRRLGPRAQMRRAVERFNSTDEARKVAGLIRSLGEPRVAVRANGTGRVLVTVAWELSWYQWEVGADGSEAVREVRKGKEISELDDSERAWNARADTDGKLRLEAAAAGDTGGQPGE
jgi:hypothetical protein